MLLEVFDLRRRKPPAAEPDRLLDQLHQVERDLKKWISSSSKNAVWFRRDPLGQIDREEVEIRPCSPLMLFGYRWD
jgi:hypothetical protein